MSDFELPDYLQKRNSLRRSQWQWKWHLQGGSKFWAARDMEDLRNAADLLRYREIELKRRHTKYGRRLRIINLAHERLERVRRKARSAL